MGSHERREREKLELRGKILAAARDLFAKRGVEAVTMRAIAERIEYTPTSIYLHFADKTALLRAILTEDFLLFASQLHVVASTEDPLERLREAAHAYVQFGLNHPNHYRLMFMTPLDEPDVEPGVKNGVCAEDAYAFLQQMVSDAAKAGALKDELTDLELVCQLYFTTLHGLVSMHIAHRLCLPEGKHPRIEWSDVDSSLDLIVDTLFAGTMKPEARARLAKTPKKKRKA